MMSLRYALLTALADGHPRSGYDLLAYFDGSIGFVWHATHPQIYRELDGLRRDGLVSNELVVQTGRPNKKVYSITEQGTHALLTWVATASPLQMMKDGMLLRTFSYGRLDSELAVARLADYRALHEERMVRYRELTNLVEASPDRPSRLGYLLVLRAGILHQEAYLRWCDEAVAAIRARPRAARRSPGRKARPAARRRTARR